MRIDKSKINMELVAELQKYILKNKSVINIACYEYIDRRWASLQLGERWKEKKKEELMTYYKWVLRESLHTVGGHCLHSYSGASIAMVGYICEGVEDPYLIIENALVDLKEWFQELTSWSNEDASRYGYTIKYVDGQMKVWYKDWAALKDWSFRYWLYDCWVKASNYIKSKWEKV